MIDRVIASLQEHALPGVELSRPSDPTTWLTRGLRITTPESLSWVRGFNMGRFGAPSPRRYANAVWSVVYSCACINPDDDGYFDWGPGWKSVNVKGTPGRITVTLKNKDGRTLELSPIDISDQGF